MKVLEIKNNLVKISYDIDDNLTLSGFVIIEDTNCPYVAQVVSLKADSLINTAIVKLLFTFDNEGILKNYNGTIPSIKATVSKLPSNELLDVLPVDVPIKLGAVAQQGIPLFVDKSIFDHNFVVCCNKQENINTFVNNMLPQLESLKQKTVVIDVDGEFEYDNKFEFGYDFKLPLNYVTLNYIFDHDLEDVDVKSKAVIQDIFYEVQEYSKTLPLGFIPFNTFLEVVDSQYKETQIPELVLLKNKLLKYRDDNVFALNSVEITGLSEYLQHNTVSVLSLSKIDGDLQRQAINYIYDVMSQAYTSVYSIIKLNNYNASKKLIKRFLAGGNIATTVICGHEFKYLQELKQVAENFVFFAPLTTQHDFAAYNIYLNKLNPEEFVVYGNVTQEIPFIAELEEFTQEDLQPKVYSADKTINTNTVKSDEGFEETTEQPQIMRDEEDLTAEGENYSQTIDLPQHAEDTAEQDYEDTVVAENNIEVSSVSEPIIETEQEYNTMEGENAAEEPETLLPAVEPVSSVLEEEQEDDVVVTPLVTETDDQIISQEQTENNELPDVVSEPFENVLQELPQEIDQEQIVRDVDDILYNKKDVDEDIPPLEDDEEITEDDLNMIDNLNNAMPAAEGEETELNIEPVIVEDQDEAAEIAEIKEIDELPDGTPEIVEDTENEDAGVDEQELTANASEIDEIVEDETPVVPVYPANDIPQTSSEIFEAGDQVSHPKYGNGVVEKMIKYGNKVLCSINFENIGRRLLDPAISEITKI